MSISQLIQEAENGNVEIRILHELNAISKGKLFTEGKIQEIEEKYYGKLAKDYLRNPGNSENTPNGVTSIGDRNYDLKLIEPNILGNSQFGYSVSNAGDVNGDGYPDDIPLKKNIKKSQFSPKCGATAFIEFLCY